MHVPLEQPHNLYQSCTNMNLTLAFWEHIKSNCHFYPRSGTLWNCSMFGKKNTAQAMKIWSMALFICCCTQRRVLIWELWEWKLENNFQKSVQGCSWLLCQTLYSLTFIFQVLRFKGFLIYFLTGLFYLRYLGMLWICVCVCYQNSSLLTLGLQHFLLWTSIT